MKSLGLWTLLKLALTNEVGVIIFSGPTSLFAGFEAKEALKVKNIKNFWKKNASRVFNIVEEGFLKWHI